MAVADEFPRCRHAQTPLILGAAKRETPEIIVNEEDHMLGCHEETVASRRK